MGDSWRDYKPAKGARSTPIGGPSLDWRGYLPPADQIVGGTRAGDEAAPAAPKRTNKFGAVKTTARDGVVLDSAHEAQIYQDLTLLQAAGEITELRRQVRIPLDVNGLRVCEIKVDFVYREKSSGQLVYFEAKSPVTRTRQYVITRKLFEAVMGVKVTEG